MAVRKHTKLVMVIDDEPAIHDLLEKVLDAAGMKYIGVATISEALQKAEEQVPHLFILDMNLDGELGFDFLRDRLTRKTIRDIPCIVLSGDDSKAYVHMATNLGAKDYMIKPVNVAVLLRKIKKTLISQSEKLTYTFTNQKKACVRATSVGKLIALNETKLQIEPSIHFRKNEKIELSSDLLSELEIHDQSFSSVSSISHLVDDGKFLNQLSINGLTESKRKLIRKKTFKW